MIRLFRICLYTLIVALSLSCAAEDSGDIGPANPPPTSKPTVPIKRRPITPTTKLPRPRVIETIDWLRDNIVRLSLCEAVVGAEVIVRDIEAGTWESYAIEGTSIDIPLPDAAAEVVIYLAEEEYTIMIE
jgi:hypothetical protein